MFQRSVRRSAISEAIRNNVSHPICESRLVYRVPGGDQRVRPQYCRRSGRNLPCRHLGADAHEKPKGGDQFFSVTGPRAAAQSKMVDWLTPLPIGPDSCFINAVRVGTFYWHSTAVPHVASWPHTAVGAALRTLSLRLRHEATRSLRRQDDGTPYQHPRPS